MARTTEQATNDLLRERIVELLKRNTLEDYVEEAYEIACSKGWHDNPVAISTSLALIHSEVSEALEADRKGDRENFIEELADVCIRVFDLCGLLDINLEAAIQKKMEANRLRTYKHGGKAY